MWINRDFYRRHLDELYAAWQGFDYYQGKKAELRHPIRIDFGDGKGPPPFWGRNCDIAPVPDLTFEGRPAGFEKC